MSDAAPAVALICLAVIALLQYGRAELWRTRARSWRRLLRAYGEHTPTCKALRGEPCRCGWASIAQQVDEDKS